MKNIKLYMCIKFNFLRNILLSKAEMERLEIAEFKYNLIILGIDASDFSDQKVYKFVEDFSKVVNGCGLSKDDLINVCNNLKF